MKHGAIGVWTVAGVLAFAGCTSYRVSIRTFPAGRAEIFVDGERVGETSQAGRANITTGSRSIFAEPLLEVRNNEQRARLVMAYGAPGSKIDNVVRATSMNVGFKRFYEVVISFAANPLPPFTKEIAGGRNRFRVSNPNDFVSWVGVRSGGNGADLIVFAYGSETIDLPDGTYDVFFANSAMPDALGQGESVMLRGSSAEAQIVKDESGKFTIRKVK